MNYCTLDEAWGNSILKESRKKRKTKRLYTTKIPPHVYDKSYEEDGHDPHCKNEPKKTFTVKNKNRYDKSRGTKDQYRPKRSSRVDNINLRYDEANKEYKKYKKETKRNTKNKLSQNDLLDEDLYSPIYSESQELNYMDADEVAEYSPIQENDMALAPIPDGSNLSESYVLEDNDVIQRKMMEMRKEQGRVLSEQREMVNQQGNGSNIEPFDNYYQNSNVEPFENNNNELDLLNLEENAEEQRVSDIEDIEVRPSDSGNIVDQMIDNRQAKNRNRKTNNKKSNNANNANNANNVKRVEDDDSSDSENESDTEDLSVVEENSGDLEYRLNNLNRNVNLIIKKMNSSHIFDSDSEENIHDLILFILFGIFIIFVLDTIYRFGRNSSSK